jgi:hypothetical protein
MTGTAARATVAQRILGVCEAGNAFAVDSSAALTVTR